MEPPFMTGPCTVGHLRQLCSLDCPYGRVVKGFQLKSHVIIHTWTKRETWYKDLRTSALCVRQRWPFVYYSFADVLWHSWVRSLWIIVIKQKLTKKPNPHSTCPDNTEHISTWNKLPSTCDYLFVTFKYSVQSFHVLSDAFCPPFHFLIFQKGIKKIEEVC